MSTLTNGAPYGALPPRFVTVGGLRFRLEVTGGDCTAYVAPAVLLRGTWLLTHAHEPRVPLAGEPARLALYRDAWDESEPRAVIDIPAFQECTLPAARVLRGRPLDVIES